jgi:hypothetical protein
MPTARSKVQGTAAAEAELICLIYQAVTDPSAWHEILRRLQRVFSAEAVLLGRHDLASKTGACVYEIGMDAGLCGRYEAEFAGKNPWMAVAGRYQPLSVVTGEDILPNAELMRTEFYQHYLRPQRLLHRLCGVALRSGPQFWYLTTARRPGQPGFGGAEKREVARFLPTWSASWG